MTAISMDNEQDKPKIEESLYRKRIRSWALYDWANSAFATTILAALLPAYFSQVAGATLPSAATATAYWSLTGSISLFIVALLSPVLGTVSDVMRGKKKFLSFFLTLGVLFTGLLVMVNTGDWLLAALLFVFARIGFAGANVFYDALLPHVAREEDQDRVSTQGYALGYLGGGILLAVNVAMFMLIPDSLFENAGIRLAFLSVAVWWLIFSIPLLRDVPEPPSASADLKQGESIIGTSFTRMRETFGNLRQYRELFKYLVAFLIYNDGINTIIVIATIYGAELGLGLTELVLAILLVQFAGIPFSLIFGKLPEKGGKYQPFFVAFIILNLIVMPAVGLIAVQVFDMETSGARPPTFETTDSYYGEGLYLVGDDALAADDNWSTVTVTGEEQAGDNFLSAFVGTPDALDYARSDTAGSRYEFALNGQSFELTYDIGSDRGILAIEVDGQPLTETDDEGNEQAVVIDMYNSTVRYNETETIELPEAGQYTIALVNTGQANSDSNGSTIAIAKLKVLPASRINNLGLILGLILATQVILLAIAWFAQKLFLPLANYLDTRRSILMALVIYGAIAIWGFVLDSTIEYWFLAWMVAVVQGGSQALSRSLYASLCPASKSGEFFGLFSILSKFSAILGPLLFAGAVATFGNSRPAILSLIVLFALGGFLLTRVNIEEGRRVAKEEDAQVFGTASA
jgi:MFS transporter, UMF1 family